MRSDNTKLRDARQNSQLDRNRFGLGLVALLAVVLLASCGPVPSQPTEPASEQTAAVEPTPEATPSAEPAQEGTVVVTQTVSTPCSPLEQATPFSTQVETKGGKFWWNETEMTKGEVGGGIAVVVPVTDSTSELTVLKLPFEDPGSDSGFTMTRPVVNFEIIAPDNCLVESFPIPIELYIAYTTEDLSTAGGDSYPGLPGNLAFAYYDDANAKWVRFSSENNLVFLHQDGDKFMKLGLDPESNTLKWLDACPDEEECALPPPCIGFPDTDGCAFVTVETWADRRIGGGY